MLTAIRPAASIPILFCAVLVGGCAGNGPRNPEADGRAYAGRTMAVILPEASSASLRDKGRLSASLRTAFPDAPSESTGAVFVRAFGEAFWSGLAPSLDYIVPTRVPDSLPSAPDDRRVHVVLPGAARSGAALALSAPDSAWLADHGAGADLILALGPLSASTTTEERNSFKFGGSVRITALKLEGGYLLWDYAGRRALAQGRFRSRTEYRGSPRGKDWMRAFDEALRSMGEGLPFKGPKWYRMGP